MINNKFRIITHHSVKKGLSFLKVHKVEDPSFFPYAWEDMVTNGLGYKPVRKVMREAKNDTQEGLLRHLANMDYTVLLREEQMQEALTKYNVLRFLSFESEVSHTFDEINDRLKERMKVVRDLIDTQNSRIEDYAARINHYESELKKLKKDNGTQPSLLSRLKNYIGF